MRQRLLKVGCDVVGRADAIAAVVGRRGECVGKATYAVLTVQVQDVILLFRGTKAKNTLDDKIGMTRPINLGDVCIPECCSREFARRRA